MVTSDKKLIDSVWLAWWLLVSSFWLVACDSTTDTTAAVSSQPPIPRVTSPEKLDTTAWQTAAAKLNPTTLLNEPDYGLTTPTGIMPRATNITGMQLTDVQISTNAGDNSTSINGTLEGGRFVLKFPAGWNGELLLYEHGYRAPANASGATFGDSAQASQTQPTRTATTNPAVQALFENVFSQKFAWGYSEYAKPDGYAVRSGIESTHLLKKLLENLLPLKRTYLVGESMGGNVLLGLIEKYPNDYAGAMGLCGVVAGWYEETRFISDFRLVYDYFTKPLGAPFALPHAGTGEAGKNDPAFTLGAVYNSLNALFGKVATDPNLKGIVRQIAQVTGANPDLLSFLTVLLGANPDNQDVALTTGGNGYSNQGKVYHGSDNDTTLNAGVQRLPAQPAATAYLNNWYAPQGNFKTKLLSIHNLIDPLVPYEFEGILKVRVAAKANSQNLVQQVVDARPVNTATPFAGGPLHCFFRANQLNSGWNSLRGWVENNAKPEDGANITNK